MDWPQIFANKELLIIVATLLPILGTIIKGVPSLFSGELNLTQRKFKKTVENFRKGKDYLSEEEAFFMNRMINDSLLKRYTRIKNQHTRDKFIYITNRRTKQQLGFNLRKLVKFIKINTESKKFHIPKERIFKYSRLLSEITSVLYMLVGILYMYEYDIILEKAGYSIIIFILFCVVISLMLWFSYPRQKKLEKLNKGLGTIDTTLYFENLKLRKPNQPRSVI